MYVYGINKKIPILKLPESWNIDPQTNRTLGLFSKTEFKVESYYIGQAGKNSLNFKVRPLKTNF